VSDKSGEEKEVDVLADASCNFVFNKKWEQIFLYGECVDDFLNIDKQKIFAIAFSATQEIDRIQQVEKTKLEAAETKLEEQTIKLAAAEVEITTLKTTLVDVLSRLIALE
jgi:hypothetical protein